MTFAPTPTAAVSLESEHNTSFMPLGASETFIGEWEDVKDYAEFSVCIFSDQASVSDGLKLQWSSNGIDKDFEESTTVNAGVGRGFAFTARARYFRISYVNGPQAQTAFRLGVVYHASGTGLITRPLDKGLTDENFAQSVRAVLCAKGPDGTYVNLKCTADGKLIVKVSNID